MYKVGQNCPGFGRHLNGLFKQAVTAGKRVRSETSISSGAVSVSSAAAELAQLKLPTHDFNDAKVGVGGWTEGGGGITGFPHVFAQRSSMPACFPPPRAAPFHTPPHLAAQVCIIGAGKMSKLLVKHLSSKGCTRVTVLNRRCARGGGQGCEGLRVCSSGGWRAQEQQQRGLALR